jgi:diguanylate cyclase (GGDEF)-like protein
MFSRFGCFAFVLMGFALAGGRSSAAEAIRPLDLSDVGAPAFSNFTPRDGLPNSVVTAACTDRDGFVWVASPKGVARYDGRRWTPSEDPGMEHPVYDLALDGDGTLWASFRGNGVAWYDGAHWHVEDADSGIPSVQVRRFALTRDAAGVPSFWALTWDKGLMQRRDGHWVLDRHNGELPVGPLLTMASTRRIGGHARQWVGTNSNGLWFRDDGGAWQRFRADGFEAGQVEYLYASEHAGREELWISVFGSAIWRLGDDGSMRSWTREAGEIPTDDIYDITETPLANGDRAIWISSRSGLIRIHEDRTETFDRRHGLPSDVVRGIGHWRSPSGEEVLWLATEAGVSRTVIGANAWQTASLLGVHGTGVFAVRVEPDDSGGERLWVGASDDGIGLFEDGRWRHFNAANGALPNSNIRMIKRLTDARGASTLWIGTGGGYLVRVGEDLSFTTEATPWPHTNDEAVFDLLARDVGGRTEKWIALRRGGLWRWRDGAWSASGPTGIAGPLRVDRLLEQHDASGRAWLWATTDRGLARYDGERWDLFARDAGVPDVDLLDASLIDDAKLGPVLWIGSAGNGIVRVGVRDPAHPVVLANDLPPVPDPTVYGARADSQGRIYICTNNGVQQLTPTPSGYLAQTFTRKDGMVHDECNTDAQFIDAHDRYWTGTLGGLTVYDPSFAHDDAQPKALHVVDMRIDGERVDGDSLHVPPSAREIDITYALLSWQREGESRFRTQLVGYEAEPQPWSANTTRSFNALAPGRYTLRVEGRDYAGNVSTPVEIAIAIEAHWWQQTWARVLFAIGLVLLGVAAMLLRTSVLKAQRRELELRVAERTAELNAANARLVDLSYNDELTGLANRRRLLDALQRIHADAPGGARAMLIFIDVDFFKDYNDRFGHPAGDEALRAVATQIRLCSPPGALVARYGGEEFACLWPGASAEQGEDIAECIRRSVAATTVAIPGSAGTMHVTISAGVSSLVVADAAAAHRLMHDADIALYRAKRDGRNRVRVFAEA